MVFGEVINSNRSNLTKRVKFAYKNRIASNGFEIGQKNSNLKSPANPILIPQYPDIAIEFKRYALHERGMRPRSYQAIDATIKRLCKWAGTDEVTDLTAGSVRAFLYWGKEERCWAARTFRNARAYIRSFFHWCVRQGYTKSNPTDEIASPRLPRRLPRALTQEDIRTILNRARWYPWRYQFESIRNEAMIAFLVMTGLRLREMINLESHDVCLENKEVLVRNGKGQKERIVPIHVGLVPILRRYNADCKQRKKTGRYFFPSVRSDLPLTDKNIRSICSKLTKDTGIKFTPHMLRHTFAKLAIEGGMNLYLVKETMGHSDIATTQNYLSVSKENLKKQFQTVTLI